MSVKLLKTVRLLSTILLLLFIVDGVNCKDTELFEELKGREIPLTERIAKYASGLAKTDWDNLITANLNGYYNTLVYNIYPQDFNKLPGFNTTKLTTVALLGHFALIISGVYFLSLLPAGSLNGLIPRMDFRNPFSRRKRRRRFRPRPQPYYHDYDYHEYEDDYEYSFGPPRDHHKRILRHGPPVFNRRMVEANSNNPDTKAQRRNKFKSRRSSMDSDDDINTISYEEQRHPTKLVKRQATTEAPWWARLMNFATGPFTRFQRSYSQLFDHYGDFWRFRLSSDEPTAKKETSLTRIHPPRGVLENIKSFNNGINNILTRLTTGVDRIANGDVGLRRSWVKDAYFPNTRPQRHRHQGNRRRFRHGQNQHHHFQGESRSFNPISEVEEDYGPPPSAPSEEVVQALHE